MAFAAALAQQQSAREGGADYSEIRRRLLFVLFAFFIFRFGSYITIPGVDPQAMVELFEQQRGGILDMFNMFGGGALSRMSIFALGVMPYISASIIIQLMSHVVPTMERWRKEGEQGRRRITRYTRYLALVFATFQGTGACLALQGQAAESNLLYYTGPSFVFTGTLTLVTGTMFLMWLGEQITERGIGNGISLLIFAGIVSGLPGAIGGTIELARIGEIPTLALILLCFLVIGVTAFVVFIERGQRRIPINYARRQQGGRQVAAQSSHLPLKLNMAGVIPPIFASSIILFPTTFLNFASDASLFGWLEEALAVLRPGQPLYVLFYAAAIVFFCFFYTAIVFNSKETADNLKRSGAFIPGFRPGAQTASHIDGVLTRLTVAGSIYITLVCLLPEFLILFWQVPFYFGGTSLLIIVVVTMDFFTQLQSHTLNYRYQSLMRKAHLQGYRR